MIVKKLLSMDEIHEVELGILKDFHQWCVENNARYSITYGTLIGQIRYQGFIPWDNDVDVMMPRPDYEKLIDFYRKGNKIKDNLEVVHYDLDETYHASFARITDTNTTIHFDYLTEQFKHSGVWIDIFPLDGFYPEKHTKLKENYRVYTRIMYRLFQYGNTDKPKTFNTKELLKYYTKEFIIRFLNNDHNRYTRKVDEMIKKVPYDGDNVLVADMTQAYPCFIEKAQFDDLALVPFEDTEVYAIKDYDAYLSYMYGDYITPPPEDKRKTHHYKAYWVK